MIDGSSGVDDLRRAFRDRPGDPPPDECPPTERLEAAARDRCSADEFNRLLDHTVTCAACAAGWRIARAIRDEEAVTAKAARRRLAVPAWTLAAAAVVVVAVGVTLVPPLLGPSRAPVYRSNDLPSIESEIEDGSTLPRQRLLLRWSCDLEDAVYSVRVMDPDLKPLASADHLEAEEFLVPQEAVADLASGDTVLWRVEAFHPDGPRVPSPVFSIRLE